jgi:FtsP/CotA-like multicopper oxidase with cupredoxin domain
VYDFSTGKQAGTYWYHAHTHGQYMEGIRAALIIHDPDDPYYNKEYDYEYVITMSDWYHQRIADLIERRMAPNYPGFNPIPDSGLISGVGRYDCSAAPSNSNCRANNPLAVYKVAPGKRYRLRLINTSGLTHYIFSIDNHPLKIIEADGIYSRPLVVNKLPVAIGQRYSVIIDANKKVDNYWMRATIDNRCIPTINNTINADSAINYNVTGILRYEGADFNYPRSTEFSDNVDTCLGLGSNRLKMLYPEQLPGPVTNKILFNITFGQDDRNIARSFINNSSFVVHDSRPTLEQIVTNNVPLNQFDSDQNLYPYDNPGGTVDLTVLNANGGIHPFHMHGHVFYVLGTGPGLVVDESKLNFADPFPRDVFTLNSTSWSVFRYKADNPGIWSIHCHIEWHVEMGMVAQLVELPSEISKLRIPDSVTNLCQQYSDSQKRSLPSRLSRRSSRYRVEMKSTKLR